MPEAATETTVELNGVRLYTRRVGHGPPVVVLHGGPGAHHDYLLPQYDQLAEGAAPSSITTSAAAGGHQSRATCRWAGGSTWPTSRPCAATGSSTASPWSAIRGVACSPCSTRSSIPIGLPGSRSSRRHRQRP